MTKEDFKRKMMEVLGTASMCFDFDLCLKVFKDLEDAFDELEADRWVPVDHDMPVRPTENQMFILKSRRRADGATHYSLFTHNMIYHDNQFNPYWEITHYQIITL